VDVEVEDLLVGGWLGAIQEVDAVTFEAVAHAACEALGGEVRCT
jgi:hypothetical protein